MTLLTVTVFKINTDDTCLPSSMNSQSLTNPSSLRMLAIAFFTLEAGAQLNMINRIGVANTCRKSAMDGHNHALATSSDYQLAFTDARISPL